MQIFLIVKIVKFIQSDELTFIANTIMTPSINTKPNALFGTDRKTPYKAKKYHSGLICVGLSMMSAYKKFSGSIVTYLNLNICIENNKMIGNISL